MSKIVDEAKYNGYRNRETWNVILWMMNEEPLYRSAVEVAERHKSRNRTVTSRTAERFARDCFGDQTPDGCKMGRVNWRQVADAIQECA